MVRRRTLIGLTACLLSAGGLAGSFALFGDAVALRKARSSLSRSFRIPLGVRSGLWGMMYLRHSVGWSSEIAVVREALQYLLRDGFEWPVPCSRHPRHNRTPLRIPACTWENRPLDRAWSWNNRRRKGIGFPPRGCHWRVPLIRPLQPLDLGKQIMLSHVRRPCRRCQTSLGQ